MIYWVLVYSPGSSMSSRCLAEVHLSHGGYSGVEGGDANQQPPDLKAIPLTSRPLLEHQLKDPINRHDTGFVRCMQRCVCD